ncbi:MAG: hypothetical protein ACJAXR_001167 [Halopseudomonas sp.]|jgi:hypothetical protein
MPVERKKTGIHATKEGTARQQLSPYCYGLIAIGNEILPAHSQQAPTAICGTVAFYLERRGVNQPEQNAPALTQRYQPRRRNNGCG